MNPEALAQLARLSGHAGFCHALGLPEAEQLPRLDSNQIERLRPFLDTRIEQIAAGLLQEAMASDDIQNPAGADAYLEDRFAFLGDLLTVPQQNEIRRRFHAESVTWR